MTKILHTPPVPAASNASVNTVKKEPETTLTQKIKKLLENVQGDIPEKTPSNFDDYA